MSKHSIIFKQIAVGALLCLVLVVAAATFLGRVVVPLLGWEDHMYAANLLILLFFVVLLGMIPVLWYVNRLGRRLRDGES